MKHNLLKNITDIRRRDDGTFVVNNDGLPFGVSDTGDTAELYKVICEYIKENPSACTNMLDISESELDIDLIAYTTRKDRDNLLNEVDIKLIKYREGVELGIISENKDYYYNMIKYKQELRDITKQKGFPLSIKWPTPPEDI